ncbi:MAG: hypothetical protein ACRYFS_18745 [Janthinobacterium lividum]
MPDNLQAALVSEALEDAELSLLTDDPDEWVKTQIDKAVEIRLTSDERELATLLIERAHEYAATSAIDFGLSLAASFDLFVAIAYYAVVTNTGWLYCPKTPPLLIYNFGANACSRCLLTGDFHYHPASKPPSGAIGKITRRLLCVFLACLFERNNKGIRVYIASEPVDVIVYDEAARTVLLAEAKAGPLTVLPIASLTEPQTQNDAASNIVPRPHAGTDNTALTFAPLSIMLPIADAASRTGWDIKLLPLLPINQANRQTWAREEIRRVLVDDEANLQDYFQFWVRAYAAYGNERRDPIDAVFWLTGACGAPKPKPAHWPEGKTVSDAKTTVGMDRTDDIKKATYQVLKIATAAKPRTSYRVKTALISNIHAVRHYEAYLQDFQDVVWAQDETRLAKTAGELPPDKALYNLFDGILSFTWSHSRDEWISDVFKF